MEWKARGHDLPEDLPHRPRAAGFVAEPSETVVIGHAADLSAAPAVPDGVVIRRVGGNAIAATIPYVWSPPS